MAVCSFLCFCRLFSTAEAAVYMFSMKRCPPGISASHKRYAHARTHARTHEMYIYIPLDVLCFTGYSAPLPGP